MVPRVDISALFSASAGRAEADAAIIEAASTSGFMTICGLPPEAPIDPTSRRALLRLFELPATETRKLWRQKFDPAHRNVYRGWFPLQNGHETYKEGIDLGPDLAFGPEVVDPNDPLREATPLPPEDRATGLARRHGRLFQSHGARGVGPDACARARARPAGTALRRHLRRRHLDPAPDPLSGAAARLHDRRSGGQAVGHTPAASATICLAARMSISVS